MHDVDADVTDMSSASSDLCSWSRAAVTMLVWCITESLKCCRLLLQVLAQYASTEIISPPVDPNDENAQRTKNILAFLPLMIGYFALQVPSGLSLYYFSNTVLTSAQQIWLRKLGGKACNRKDLHLGEGRGRAWGEGCMCLGLRRTWGGKFGSLLGRHCVQADAIGACCTRITPSCFASYVLEAAMLCDT